MSSAWLPARTTQTAAVLQRGSGAGLHHRGPGRQRGITLIEILVAVVLIAVGLLGLAGLQLRGIQVNQGSSMRSVAAIMAEDLADRMRSDYAALAAGSFVGKSGNSTYTLSDLGTAPVASLNDWLYGLQALPAGTAASDNPVPCGNVLPCVQIQQLATATGNPPHPVQIQIWWNDARASVASTAGVNIVGAGITPTNMVGTYKTVAELTESY